MDLPPEVEELIASLRRRLRRFRLRWRNFGGVGSGQFEQFQAAFERRLKKKPRIAGSLRGRSGKTSGGQKGHEGGTLRQVANPDAVVRHEACACGRCGSPLDANSATGHEKRQVFDIPERALLVTEHQATIYRCRDCRAETKAAFPEGVVSATQYGERLRAAAIYLNVQQLIPEDRVAQALSDLFGAPPICPASIVAWVGRKARQLRPVYEAHRPARGRGRGSPSRRNGLSDRRQAALAAHDVEPAFHLLSRRRKARRYPRGLAGGRRRPRSLPALSPAGQGRSRLLQRAYPARTQALIEIDGETWAEAMRDMLLRANAAVNKARQAGERALPPEESRAFVERYWEAVRLGLSFHRQLPKLPQKPARAAAPNNAKATICSKG